LAFVLLLTNDKQR